MAGCSDEESLKLIGVWGKEGIQAMLEGSRRNRDVFTKISRELEEVGYSKTAERCSSELRN